MSEASASAAACVDTNSPSPAIRDADTIKKELKELGEQRAQLEFESKSALAYLASTPVGVKGRLIDDEGFPRADVDHYAVREARNRLARNKNDIDALLNQMQTMLEELHAVTREETVKALGGEESILRVDGNGRPLNGGSAAKSSSAEANKKNGAEVDLTKRAAAEAPSKPFLRVANVAANSPAFTAGLRPGDVIHKFGDVDYAIFKAQGLQLLANFTRANEGQTVAITVSTPEISTTLLVEHFIVPRRWAGGGLIGAEFDPIQ